MTTLTTTPTTISTYSPADDARKSELTAAVTQLIDTYNQWEADPATSYPSEALETAIKHTAAVAASGSIPADCRQLVITIELLAVEWDAYESHAKIQPNGHPHDSLWSAYEALIGEFRGVEAPTQVQRETVSELIDQGLSYEQVARNYGSTVEVNGRLRRQGIFFGPNEIPNIAAIKQQEAYERATPEQRKSQNLQPFIPADWQHPDDVNRQAELAAQHAVRLQQLKSQQPRQEDPATIEELLREGQYPDVIAKAKLTTEDAVRALAAELDITPNERPNVAAIDFKAQKPDTAPNVDEPIQPPVDAPSDDVAQLESEVGEESETESEAEPEPEIEPPSDEDIRNTINELIDTNPDGDSPTIAKLASENLGIKIDGRRVGQVLRRRREASKE